jgi:hypothetical protein
MSTFDPTHIIISSYWDIVPRQSWEFTVPRPYFLPIGGWDNEAEDWRVLPLQGNSLLVSGTVFIEAGSAVKITDGTDVLDILPHNTPVSGLKGLLILGSEGTYSRVLKTDTDGHLQIDVLTLPAISLAASTANIGDVDVLTLPAITGTVAISNLPSVIGIKNPINNHSLRTDEKG